MYFSFSHVIYNFKWRDTLYTFKMFDLFQMETIFFQLEMSMHNSIDYDLNCMYKLLPIRI